MLKNLVLFSIVVTLTMGCGFKLRGNFEMSEKLSVVSIEGENREIISQLNDLLTKSGSTVVGSEVESPSIVITGSTYEREVRETDANGIATGYDFRYTIDFSVADANGEVLQAPVSVSQVRTLNFDSSQVLQAEEEEEFLREEMEKEIVLQMMRRLQRI